MKQTPPPWENTPDDKVRAVAPGKQPGERRQQPLLRSPPVSAPCP